MKSRAGLFSKATAKSGVTEKTDTSASSTENEVRRSNTLNFGATLSGSYGPVSLTTTLGLGTAEEDREAVKSSMQRNREVTESPRPAFVRNTRSR